eukprot:4766273-Pyramimonas_sp.AAC.1
MPTMPAHPALMAFACRNPHPTCFAISLQHGNPNRIRGKLGQPHVVPTKVHQLAGATPGLFSWLGSIMDQQNCVLRGTY